MKFNTRIILLAIFSVINIGWELGLLILSIKNGAINRFFLYLTMLNFLACTIYLSLIVIYEMFEREKSSIYIFLIHRLEKCVFTTCFTVVVGYWVLTLMGSDVMIWIENTFFYVMTLYVHLFIGILMLYEVITNKNRYYVIGFFYKDFTILTILMVVYMILLLSISKTFELYIYTFLSKDLINCIGYCCMLVSFYVLGFLLYYTMSRRLHKGKLTVEEYHRLYNEEDSSKEILTVNNDW